MSKREIKFRAWNGREMISAEEMSEDQLTLDVNSRGFINVHSASTKLSEFYTHMIPMQYTGLKDKYGVEIYEGDVVNIGFRDGSPEKWIYEPGVIKWWMPSAAFKWFSLTEDPSDANNYWLQQAYSGTREVIGNIYEHPGLLEPKQ